MSLILLPLLTIVITIMTTTATAKTGTATERIICTNSKQCTDVDMAQWAAKRRSLQRRLLTNTHLNNRSRYVDDEFCWNAYDAGFLLDEDALAWPIACVWMGGEEETGRCSPAPPGVFGYIGQQQWRRKLVKLRTAVGCPKEAVEAARQVPELYFCRDRCIQAGINYLASFIIMSSTMLSIASFLGAHC